MDTESGWVRIGLAAKLAKKLNADYFHLDDCRSHVMTETIGEYIRNTRG